MTVALEAGGVPCALPRLPQPTIRRQRIAEWIGALTGAAPRLLVAPPGFGKTTVLLQLAHDRGPAALYVRVSRERPFLTSLAVAVGSTCDESVVLRALESFDTVLLDDLEWLDARGEVLLDRILQNVRIKNLIAATARKNVIDSAHVASGLVSLCTPRMLAFAFAEIQQLAVALDLRMTDLEMLELRERCEGWPIAVTGALRTAHAFGTRSAIALENWKTDQRTTILGLLETDGERFTPRLRATWQAALAGTRVADCELRELEASGGPLVARDDGQLVALRIVRELFAQATPALEARRALSVRMFGTFECAIDETPVVWMRRMDRRIFRYLLLTKDGSEDRVALVERFWPGQDVGSAMQSLRTTCSTIKKALAALVGADRVADYFTAGERVAVNLENINVDVRRFISHMRLANARRATDSWDEALYHYRHADDIYTAHLGWGDEREEWLTALADECRALRIAGMRSTIEVLVHFGRTDEASDVEMLLAERAKRH